MRSSTRSSAKRSAWFPRGPRKNCQPFRYSGRTGLGSSGSFTVALLRALHTLNRDFFPRQELAEQACHIEIDLLGEPVGKQDQYIASFGGITSFEFRQDGAVDVQPLPISPETLYNLEDNLLLFFTGFTRSHRPSWPSRTTGPWRRFGHDRAPAPSNSSVMRVRMRWKKAISESLEPSCTSIGS